MTDLTIRPIKQISGVLQVPGDKSITHRLFLLSAIAEGRSILQGCAEGEDCKTTLAAIQQLGVSSHASEDAVVIDGVGLAGLKTPSTVINCRNAGTTVRLLMGLLSGAQISATLIGDASLSKRPMQRVAIPLRAMGAKIILCEKNILPVEIKANRRLSGIAYTLPVPSAQVKSAILLAGLYAEGETIVEENIPTRDHTERLLRLFNYPCMRKENKIYLGSKMSLSPVQYQVPGDISSAAFWLVATLLLPGSTIIIRRVGVNPTRVGILDILSRMGASILVEEYVSDDIEPVADLTVSFTALQGIDIPATWASLTIDEFPIIFVAAAKASGVTRILGLSELRLKETDRIHAMVVNLRQLGVHIEELPDGVIIEGGDLTGGIVDSFGDHRIAMAMVIAGLVATEPVVIRGIEAIDISYPTFLKDLETICRK